MHVRIFSPNEEVNCNILHIKTNVIHTEGFLV